tara:strand:+ start:6254 stop:6952 length:699 start_codon:yes stop_codon:yes gene_type:complete
MAQGFRDIQVPQLKEDSGYETIFEKVKEAAGGETKSYLWYRNAIRQYALRINDNPERLMRDEVQDAMGSEEQEDQNQIRRWVVSGHMYLFEYKAKTANKLPYYDEFPLVYVIKATRSEFWGLNLHYLTPKRRAWVVKRLFDGRIDAPRKCFHKYLTSYVDGFFLDLASSEWASAILLPVENFVHTSKKQRGLTSYPKEVVWDEINEDFYDKIKQKRIIRGYGKKEDTTMVLK